MLKVAICGGSGYTGAELLRILANHPAVEITAVTSEKSAGKKITSLFPHLYKYGHLTYEPLEKERLVSAADIFFMALPHGASQETVDFFVKKHKKVIDLSADYRIKDAKTYEQWYKVPHKFQETLKKAVYGLPELHRKKIAKASLTANPGCYPTGAILGLLPALKCGLVSPDPLIIDSKSGATGAGRKSDAEYSFCEVNENFRAYGIATHRHTPEIEQELSLISGTGISVNFTPHLLPLDRGILTTIYARLTKKMELQEIHELYSRAYMNEPFTRVLDLGKLPNLKSVRGTNLCEMGLAVNRRTNTLIIVTAIDNLVKGASGQAVQNMNIMTGIDEKTALNAVAVFP